MFASLNPGHVGIKVNLREGLALAEQHGFGGFDAQLQPIHEEVVAHGATAVRELYRQHGLQIGAWNLPFMPYRVTEDAWRNWLDILPQMLASAQKLGALRAGMWIMPGSNELEYDANWAFHVARFTPIAKQLADHNVRLGLEFIGPETSQKNFKHPFIRSVREAIALGQAIGPNCGLLLDAWHWHSAGGTREDLRGLSRDQLVHIHVDDAPAGVARAKLVDNKRKLPGTTGVIDLDGFMQALADAEYDGPVTAEPFDDEIRTLPQAESAAITAKTTRNAVARAVRTKERGTG
jgi:sugar phosphate isomerase/epimerase